MKKIAINFIGTGNYLKFFPNYYNSFNEYFAPECEKDFFVFTDGELGDEIPDNIKVINIQEDSNVTKEKIVDRLISTYHSIGGLKRFGEILKYKEYFRDYDWYVYFDSDMICESKEILYTDFFDEEKDFFGVSHPCQNIGMSLYSPKDKKFLPFERNPKSLAYVQVDEQVDDMYIQGCLWGGKVPKIFNMMKDLDKRIRKDVENEIVTFAHDESYLNRYRIENIDNFNILSPSFAKPGDMPPEHFNFECRILHSPSNKKEILLS